LFFIKPSKNVILSVFSTVLNLKQEYETMAIEQTLSIIKPDAVKKNVIGQIYTRFEAAGLKIIKAKMTHLTQAEAEGFYAVHKDRPFFKDLVSFMISGPVMIQALEGENAVLKLTCSIWTTSTSFHLSKRSVKNPIEPSS